MLAYYVEWPMRKELAPILFEDEDKEIAETARQSIVREAQRSPKAKRKEATKRTEEGYPVHSFQTLLNDLSTITKNQVKYPKGPKAEFHLLTEPTPLQRYAFELFGVSLSA